MNEIQSGVHMNAFLIGTDCHQKSLDSNLFSSHLCIMHIKAAINESCIAAVPEAPPAGRE